VGLPASNTTTKTAGDIQSGTVFGSMVRKVLVEPMFWGKTFRKNITLMGMIADRATQKRKWSVIEIKITQVQWEKGTIIGKEKEKRKSYREK